MFFFISNYLFYWKNTQLLIKYICVVGDFVYHDVFGQGKIIELSGSIATIAFKHPHGIKKLMKNHKSLKKI